MSAAAVPIPAGATIGEGVPIPEGATIGEPQQEESAASRFGASFARGAGVVSNEEGKNFFLHPLDTLQRLAQTQGELGDQARRELQNKDFVRGITHAVEYMMPGLGPQLAHAGEQLESGDIAGGVGTTLGSAVPLVAGTPEGRAAVGDVGAAAKSAGQSALRTTGKAATAVGESLDPDIVGLVSPRAAHALRLSQKVGRVATKLGGAEPEQTAATATESVPESVSPTSRAGQAKVTEQISDALGGSVPEGFTPVKSSAIMGYRYDPNAREFEAIDAKTGTHYVHGDISPEQFNEFLFNESKGKAWNQLKSNGTLVRKNGVAVKPTASAAGEPEK